MEPYFFVEVQAPADGESSVYTVLARRSCVLFELSKEQVLSVMPFLLRPDCRFY